MKQEIIWIKSFASKTHRIIYKILKYVKHIILAFEVTGCVSISAFASVVGISRRTMICGVELEMCAVNREIEM